MKIQRAGLGIPLLVALASCSGEADPSTTAAVSIRVAGFVEAAGIT